MIMYNFSKLKKVSDCFPPLKKMLELTVFPYIWLIFLITGILIKEKSHQIRSYVIIAISNIIVYSYAGYRHGFY